MKPARKKNAPAAGPFKSGLAALENQEPRWKIFAIIIFLAAITFIVYGRTLYYEFVNYDDDRFVYDNPAVIAGLTLKGIAWAFSHYCVANWVPLTLISHMLDCQLYGPDAGGHHLTNVLLHTASVILLFLVLWEMTRALWCSAFVAGVFAVHPLHVESVAWVSERKDVLSGFFFMLTLWAYVHYTRRLSLPNYLRVVALFTLGLMSKSMLVTLPFILLLLDYWPLNRFSQTSVKPVPWMKNISVPVRLILEKIPLFLLSGLCGLAAFFAGHHEIKGYPFALRASNALASYVLYICQMFHPANLAPFYPYPASMPSWKGLGAFILLAAISMAVVVWRRQRPYLLVGWLWYLIMLLPVIGLVQVDSPAHGDRYTYLPQIGLYLMLTWLAVEAGTRVRNYRFIFGAAALLMLAAFIVNACTQAAYWSDSETLWTHTLRCTVNNQIAHNNLGYALAQKGDIDDAFVHFQKAIEIDPNYEEPYNNLGNICFEKGQWDQAINYFQKAARLKPDNAEIENNLGLVYVRKGQLDEAIVHFQKAVDADPAYPDARYDLNTALSQREKASTPASPR